MVWWMPNTEKLESMFTFLSGLYVPCIKIDACMLAQCWMAKARINAAHTAKCQRRWYYACTEGQVSMMDDDNENISFAHEHHYCAFVQSWHLTQYFLSLFVWVNALLERIANVPFLFCRTSTYPVMSHGHFCFVKAHFMLKLTVFELDTWFLVWMGVFDQNEDGSTHFLIFALFDIRFLPFLKTLKNQKCHFLS